MRIYIGTPGNQMHAHAVNGCPVLVSFPAHDRWLDDYMPSFSHLLIDSGAYSELNSGVKVDLAEYVDWAAQYSFAEAWAGLDDIRGDHRRSMENYKAGGFPTFHDTDPEELLDDLVPLARERGGWLGVGLLPPRVNRDAWLQRTLERVPDDLRIHGWALGGYAPRHPRVDSYDSIHAYLESWKIRKAMPWLTPAEALDLLVLKVQRLERQVQSEEKTLPMFRHYSQQGRT